MKLMMDMVLNHTRAQVWHSSCLEPILNGFSNPSEAGIAPSEIGISGEKDKLVSMENTCLPTIG